MRCTQHSSQRRRLLVRSTSQDAVAPLVFPARPSPHRQTSSCPAHSVQHCISLVTQRSPDSQELHKLTHRTSTRASYLARLNTRIRPRCTRNKTTHRRTQCSSVDTHARPGQSHSLYCESATLRNTLYGLLDIAPCGRDEPVLTPRRKRSHLPRRGTDNSLLRVATTRTSRSVPGRIPSTGSRGLFVVYRHPLSVDLPLGGLPGYTARTWLRVYIAGRYLARVRTHPASHTSQVSLTSSTRSHSTLGPHTFYLTHPPGLLRRHDADDRPATQPRVAGGSSPEPVA